MRVTTKSAAVRQKQLLPVAASNSQSTTLASLDLARTRQDKTVVTLPSSLTKPFWLLKLCLWQRRFSAITFLLVTTTVGVYGWTVYCQQTWSQAYRKLDTLQRNERQLMTQSQQIKSYLAQQAQQPAAGLTPPDPAQTVFLPAPTRATTPVSTTKPQDPPQLTPTPLGY